jgi:hypothetical protein
MHIFLASLGGYLAQSSPTCPEGANCFAAAGQHQWSLVQRSARQSVGQVASDLKIDQGLAKPGVLGYLLDDLLPKHETIVPQSNDTSLCEADAQATSQTFCPSSCPYAAEMSNEFCHFRCVQKKQCGLLGTVENATIPDDDMMACRHCKVEACAQCVAAKPGQEGEKLEHCVKCMPGYSLTEEGECEMVGISVFVAIGVVGAVIAVGVIWYYAMILAKPFVNPEGVEYGLKGRDRMKLFPTDSVEPYPLTTNLLTTNVAGPATMAFFRYEAAVLIWAVVLLAVWLGFAFFVSTDLLILGTRDASTPQLLCAVVEWGRKRQMELVWTKVSWLAFAYVFSFLGAIAYGVQQTKMIATVNNDEATMTSFALMLEGLPKFTGEEMAEDAIMSAVKSATKIQPVGVSIAWNYDAHAHEIEHAIDAELEEVHDQVHGGEQAAGLEHAITDQVLQAWHVHLHEGHGHGPEHVKSLLRSLETTSTAFVVFPSQKKRKEAFEAAKNAGITVNNVTCSVSESNFAPESLFWQNFHVTTAERSWKMVISWFMLFVACCIWTVVLYIPYALYMASFSFANGDEPGKFSESIFIALVVGSQIGLFVVSSMGAKNAKFRSEDETQKTYVVFYNAALILNLVMDIALQTFLSYQQMVGVGAHVSDGRLLGSLTNFQEIFESYPIQKSVGKLLYTYCWPCTFLVPFLAEPFVAWLLPWFTAQKLVGANKKIQGENAIKALELGEMEQGRYADLLFNAILVVCIPFITPAYLAWILGAFIVSHVYIYLFDQVAVLRYKRKFNFSGPDVHWLGMQLWAIPCSILAGALVFKANQMSGGVQLGSGFLKGRELWFSILGAVALHLVVHYSVLEFFVKPFSIVEEDDKVDDQYEVVAAKVPATHFSTNPVNCLRSKYILNHSPPQVMYSAGKEHLMKANPKIGAHFEIKEK